MTLTCRVLKLCRAQYYRWLAEPVTEAEKVRNRRVAALWAAHADDPQAGGHRPVELIAAHIWLTACQASLPKRLRAPTYFHSATTARIILEKRSLKEIHPLFL